MPDQPGILRTPEGGPPTGAASSSGPSPGIWRRFLAMFHSPRRAFGLPFPSGMWVVPLVVISLVAVTQTVLLHDLTAEKQRTMIERNASISEEQKSHMLDRIEEAQRSPAGQVLPLVGVIFGTWLIGYLLPSALYLLGLNFVLGARARFAEVFAVTAFSGLIMVPRDLLRVPIMLAKGSLDVYLSPAAFVNPDNTALVLGLNFFDVFDLYRLFVLAVGFAVITGMPMRRAGFPVVLVWLLYGLATVGCMLSPIGRLMR